MEEQQNSTSTSGQQMRMTTRLAKRMAKNLVKKHQEQMEETSLGKKHFKRKHIILGPNDTMVKKTRKIKFECGTEITDDASQFVKVEPEDHNADMVPVIQNDDTVKSEFYNDVGVVTVKTEFDISNGTMNENIQRDVVVDNQQPSTYEAALFRDRHTCLIEQSSSPSSPNIAKNKSARNSSEVNKEKYSTEETPDTDRSSKETLDEDFSGELTFKESSEDLGSDNASDDDYTMGFKSSKNIRPNEPTQLVQEEIPESSQNPQQLELSNFAEAHFRHAGGNWGAENINLPVRKLKLSFYAWTHNLTSPIKHFSETLETLTLEFPTSYPSPLKFFSSDDDPRLPKEQLDLPNLKHLTLKNVLGYSFKWQYFLIKCQMLETFSVVMSKVLCSEVKLCGVDPFLNYLKRLQDSSSWNKLPNLRKVRFTLPTSYEMGYDNFKIERAEMPTINLQISKYAEGRFKFKCVSLRHIKGEDLGTGAADRFLIAKKRSRQMGICSAIEEI